MYKIETRQETLFILVCIAFVFYFLFVSINQLLPIVGSTPPPAHPKKNESSKNEFKQYSIDRIVDEIIKSKSVNISDGTNKFNKVMIEGIVDTTLKLKCDEKGNPLVIKPLKKDNFLEKIKNYLENRGFKIDELWLKNADICYKGLTPNRIPFEGCLFLTLTEITAPIGVGAYYLLDTDKPSKTDSESSVKKTDNNNEPPENAEPKSELPSDDGATKKKTKGQASTDSEFPVKKTDINNNKTSKDTESKIELSSDDGATKKKTKGQASPITEDEKVTP